MKSMRALTSLPPLIQRRSAWSLIRPREHGSWSLVLEPLIFGLILFHSRADLLLALGVLSAFFARRPWQRIFADRGHLRLQAIHTFTQFALAAGIFGAVALQFAQAHGQLSIQALGLFSIPLLLCLTIFLVLDLRGRGRSLLAEICGATVFTGLTGVLGLFAGAPLHVCIVATLLMLLRTVPSVTAVRECLAELKNRPSHFWISHVTFLMIATVLLFSLGDAAGNTILLLAVISIFLKITALLVLSPSSKTPFASNTSMPPVRSLSSPILTARRIGVFEMSFGLSYVLTLGFLLPDVLKTL